MKLNKIKTTLLLAELNQLKKPFKFFTLEKNPPNRKSRNIALSKTLTKILAKNIRLSNHIDAGFLKFPLTINFFKSYSDLIKHLEDDSKKKDNNIIFINADVVALKENNSKKIASISNLNLFNTLNSIFLPTLLVMKCLQISSANNTTKS